jgi:phosphohistidine phosphatase
MASRLYLVRHAIAAERGPAWPDDSRRPLTKRGEVRMRRVVEGFARLGEPVDLILTSPYSRALDTAVILADGLDGSSKIRSLPALVPGGAPAHVLSAVAKAAPDAHHIALVGHEPDLGTLAAWLIGATHPLPFKKGGMCRIDVESWATHRPGRLVWFATPRMLR